jgi:hypothetical protein
MKSMGRRVLRVVFEFEKNRMNESNESIRLFAFWRHACHNMEIESHE